MASQEYIKNIQFGSTSGTILLFYTRSNKIHEVKLLLQGHNNA